MPRQPDPDLEERILRAADALWRRGGEKGLTMRAVARAAGTNTPAVYRRFKNREDLLKALLLRVVATVRQNLEAAQTIDGMAEGYMNYALQNPNEYQLFFSHIGVLDSKKRSAGPPPIRESRPNFGLVERRMAQQLGGEPEDYTDLALQFWCLLHGAAMLLLTRAIPRGHEEGLKTACRAAVKSLVQPSQSSSVRAQ
jgi:AcrR family transcriptional regulator